MSFRDTQNPGIGGLEELTDAEQLFVQNLAGLSFANGDILYYNNGLQRLPKGSDSDVLTLASGLPSWAAGGGSGTVMSVSVASANGFAGSVANATSTPAITISTTITGLLKGNGTAISAAVAGTDYVVPSVTTLSSLVSIGTITTGVWNASVIPGQYGGTGVANTGKTFTIGGNFETSGAFTTTLVVTGNTSVTLPTTGTLATIAGSEAFSNKTFSTVVTPTANDGAALGTGTLMWSDLFLADGSVINWNNGDLTLTHSANVLTLAGGTLVLPASGLQIGSSNPFSDSAGTLTLQNVDAIDATTEATIEAAIDTLANLTSIQGRTVNLADAGANAIFGWDDTAGAYENLTQAEVRAIIGTASDTVQGVVELAIASEINTGTSTSLAVSPDGLAGSYAGTKSISIQVYDGTTDAATGDGKAYITIPESLNGMNLVRAQATVVTAGTTNATTVMVHNKTDAADMLSGAISIASGGTVGTVGTINGSTDDVATNDVLRIDIDSVSTTPPKGLMVVLEFRLP